MYDLSEAILDLKQTIQTVNMMGYNSAIILNI